MGDPSYHALGIHYFPSKSDDDRRDSRAIDSRPLPSVDYENYDPEARATALRSLMKHIIEHKTTEPQVERHPRLDLAINIVLTITVLMLFVFIYNLFGS